MFHVEHRGRVKPDGRGDTARGEGETPTTPKRTPSAKHASANIPAKKRQGGGERGRE